jgi:hypothetical protein
MDERAEEFLAPALAFCERNGLESDHRTAINAFRFPVNAISSPESPLPDPISDS